VAVIVVPFAAVVVAGWLAWGGSLHWHDLLVLAITYALTVVLVDGVQARDRDVLRRPLRARPLGARIKHPC